MELVTGATASLSELELYDEDGKLICSLDDDQRKMSSYPVENGFRIHVSRHCLPYKVHIVYYAKGVNNAFYYFAHCKKKEKNCCHHSCSFLAAYQVNLKGCI